MAYFFKVKLDGEILGVSRDGMRRLLQFCETAQERMEQIERDTDWLIEQVAEDLVDTEGGTEVLKTLRKIRRDYVDIMDCVKFEKTIKDEDDAELTD